MGCRRRCVGPADKLSGPGGIQSGAAWVGKPCITLRPSTEQVTPIDLGRNRLTQADAAAVSEALDWAEAFDAREQSTPTVWDGKASERTVKIIAEFLASA